MAGKSIKREVVSRSTQIKHDPAHCLAPGLFRSIKRGERKRGKRNLSLMITYQYGKNEQIQFVGPEPLGVNDMRVLQGLVSLAGQESTILPPEPGTDIQKRLRVLLDPKFDALMQEALMVRCKLGTLIAEIGMKNSGQTMQHVYESIKRMSYVSVNIQKDKEEAIIHLMSSMIDKKDGRVIVALNPLLTKAITGHQRYTKIDMTEVRALKTDPARLIHQRLCGWINPGGQGKITLATACDYVWPEESGNENTLKYRKRIAQKAICEIANLGWGVEEYTLQKYQIFRPLMPKPDIIPPETRYNTTRDPI